MPTMILTVSCPTFAADPFDVDVDLGTDDIEDALTTHGVDSADDYSIEGGVLVLGRPRDPHYKDLTGAQAIDAVEAFRRAGEECANVTVACFEAAITDGGYSPTESDWRDLECRFMALTGTPKCYVREYYAECGDPLPEWAKRYIDWDSLVEDFRSEVETIDTPAGLLILSH